MVGFVNLAWDGSTHAFILDATVHPDMRRRKVGQKLVALAVQEAKRAGCEWVHVDYEEKLETFYKSCGFKPTLAGLMAFKR